MVCRQTGLFPCDKERFAYCLFRYFLCLKTTIKLDKRLKEKEKTITEMLALLSDIWLVVASARKWVH